MMWQDFCTLKKIWTLGLCAKETFRFCKMPSNPYTRYRYQKVVITRLLFWAKQWTPLKNGPTFSLNCSVTLVQWSYNTLEPSQHILTSFFPFLPTLAHPISINTLKHHMKNVVKCGKDTNLVNTKEDGDPLSILGHIKVDLKAIGYCQLVWTHLHWLLWR
jgi:hypothetical protein